MNSFLLSVLACAITLVASSASLAQEIKGDAKAGQTKNAMCIGCHGISGYQATFPEVYRVPMISGQSAGYINAALNAYKKGERKHPTMTGVAQSLSEQDMADLAAFYSTQAGGAATDHAAKPAKAPSVAVAALLAKANCASCHGDNFSKPVDPSYPKIAGQHSDYLFAALKAYQTESNPIVGRGNAVMGAVAKQFSHAELRALASYMGSLDGELKTVPQSRLR